MKKYTVTLTENEIESIINNRSISKQADENTCIVIKNSLSKDIEQPILNNDKKILSTADINNIKLGAIIMNDFLKNDF